MNGRLHKEVSNTAKRGKIGITRGQALIILISFAAFFYLLSGFVFASEPKQEPQWKLVTVQPGESLWKLAVRYHQQTDMDVREYVDRLMEINHLSNAIIYPGQNLKVPIAD